MQILSWPAIYALDLTSACNQRCPACSNVYAAGRGACALPAATWASWLAQFGPQAVRIRLTGGEPTLHPEFSKILDAATAYEAWVTLFTNARWARPDQLLASLRGRPNFTGLLVSLHGARAASHETFTQTPGSFAETLANVQRALDAGIAVALCTVLHQNNLDEIDDIVALGERLGVEHVAFNRYLGPPLPALETESRLKTARSEPRRHGEHRGLYVDFTLEAVEPGPAALRLAVRHIEALIAAGRPVAFGNGFPQCLARNSSEGCLAGAAYVSIDPWGNVHPCHHSPTIAGSLHSTPFAEIWHGPAMAAWRAWADPECAGCAAYSVCHGCHALRELRPEASRADPLRGRPLRRFASRGGVRQLPGDACPLSLVRLRPEPFGYTALGQGEFLPIRPEGQPVVEACDGSATFAELAQRFGQAGLELLGDLWELGLLQTA